MIKQLFSKHSDTMRRWLTHRHLPIILAGVGILLTLPALGMGLMFDDHFHRARLLEQWPWPAEDASLFGLFSFLDGTPEEIRALKEAGFAPWWMLEEFHMRVAFWRPLTELTHWLDYQLWAETPWLMHAHSLLWFGATIWVITHLYRRIIGDVWVAGLAGLLFAVNGFHGGVAELLCHRNTLIGAFFGSLALLAHVRWRQDGWRQGAVWGSLCYLLGLLSKESALAIGAYLFAYTLFLDRGIPTPPFRKGELLSSRSHALRGNVRLAALRHWTRSVHDKVPTQSVETSKRFIFKKIKGETERLDRVHRRIMAFLPYMVITIGWYLMYRHLGFGAREVIGGFYIDPGSDPLLFVNTLFRRIPVLLLGQFTGPPIELGMVGASFLPRTLIWYAGVMVLVIVSLIMFPLFRRDAVVRFWFVGGLLGLVPMCAAMPSSRLLFFSGIGAMGIIARFLVSWVEQPVWLPARRFWKQSACVLCIIFVAVHLILSPLALQMLNVGLGILNHSIRHFVSTMPYDKDISQKTVVFVNPPIEPVVGAGISLVRAAHGYPVPARTRTLASGELPLTITRIDERTVDIEFKQGLLRTLPGHLLRGRSHPMHVGQRVELSGMSVEVLALADDYQPSRARFTFAVPLDDPSLLLLQWKGGKFVPYTAPAVGEVEILSSIMPPFLKMK
jgi:hypothetical protein